MTSAPLFFLLSLTAQPSDEAQREADMFGTASAASQPETGSAPAPSDSRETELFGQSASTTPPKPTSAVLDAMLAKLGTADSRLDLGGELYLRNQVDLLDSRAWRDHTFSSPNLLFLYLDGSPSERVRGYVSGRLNYDYTIAVGSADAFGNPRKSLDVALDQLWLKFDLARTIYVTVGRQPLRWGSSHFWNPTDFLNLQRRDPLALFDERSGLNLIKLHLPIEKWGWNFYALANLNEVRAYDEVGGALRAELTLGGSEIALSAGARKDTPLRLGVDISSGAGPFDVRLEGALYRGELKPHWRGQLDVQRGVLPQEYSRKDDWIAQLTGSGELTLKYSDQDNALLGVELFLNDAGYGDRSLYPWLALQGDYTPFYVGRMYASAYLMLAQPGDWNNTTVMLSAIANLSDLTAVVRGDYQVLALTYLQVSLFASANVGRAGEFRYALDIPPIPGDPVLANGLHIPAKNGQVGLWLVVKL